MENARYSCEILVKLEFSLQNFSETFLIVKRIKRDIIVNIHTSSWKMPVTLVRF